MFSNSHWQAECFPVCLCRWRRAACPQEQDFGFVCLPLPRLSASFFLGGGTPAATPPFCGNKTMSFFFHSALSPPFCRNNIFFPCLSAGALQTFFFLWRCLPAGIELMSFFFFESALFAAFLQEQDSALFFFVVCLPARRLLAHVVGLPLRRLAV